MIVVFASPSSSADCCLPLSSSSSSDDFRLQRLVSPSSLVATFVTSVRPLLCRRLCLRILINPILLESLPLFLLSSSLADCHLRRLGSPSSFVFIFVTGVSPLQYSFSFLSDCSSIDSLLADQGRCFKVSPGVFLQATCFTVTSVKTGLSSLLGGGGEV